MKGFAKKELFCQICSLQFNNKHVYNLHLLLVHKKKTDGSKTNRSTIEEDDNFEDIKD